MSFIQSAFGYSRTVILILIFILLSGSIAYKDIPKESEPDIDIPIIYVTLHLDGISPEDAERLLIRPVEQELKSIEGVKELRSTGYEGGANVLLEFDAGFDAAAALTDVREGVDLAKGKLPAAADDPEIHEVNFSLFPVIVVILSGDVPDRALYRLARDLKDSIEGIGEVLEVNIAGKRDGYCWASSIGRWRRGRNGWRYCRCQANLPRSGVFCSCERENSCCARSFKTNR